MYMTLPKNPSTDTQMHIPDRAPTQKINIVDERLSRRALYRGLSAVLHLLV